MNTDHMYELAHVTQDERVALAQANRRSRLATAGADGVVAAQVAKITAPVRAALTSAPRPMGCVR